MLENVRWESWGGQICISGRAEVGIWESFRWESWEGQKWVLWTAEVGIGEN